MSKFILRPAPGTPLSTSFSHPFAPTSRILGAAHDELVHSRAVGWLLDRAARHGLGDEILVRILAAGWPGELMPSAAAAIVSLEVSLYRTRSDVVVRIRPTVLVL